MLKEEETIEKGRKPLEAFKIALIALSLVFLILISVAVVMVTSTNHPGVL